MNVLHQWFLGLDDARLRLMSVFAVAAVIAFAVVSFFVGLDAAAPWVGGIAGITLYGATYVWVHRHAAEETYIKLNLKGRVELQRRRIIVIASGLLWSALLIMLAQVLPDALRVLVGTLQVVAVCCLVNAFLPTPEEVAAVAQPPADGDDSETV
jgi:hypothetical protein